MVQKLVCERSLPSRGENSSKPPSCVPQYSPRVPSRGLPRGLPRDPSLGPSLSPSLCLVCSARKS